MKPTDKPILCWLAFYTDWSSMVVFDEEIDALRHAVEKSMTVKALRDGEEIR